MKVKFPRYTPRQYAPTFGHGLTKPPEILDGDLPVPDWEPDISLPHREPRLSDETE